MLVAGSLFSSSESAIGLRRLYYFPELDSIPLEVDGADAGASGAVEGAGVDLADGAGLFVPGDVGVAGEEIVDAAGGEFAHEDGAVAVGDADSFAVEFDDAVGTKAGKIHLFGVLLEFRPFPVVVAEDEPGRDVADEKVEHVAAGKVAAVNQSFNVLAHK